MWEAIFSAVNLLAVAAWFILILLPRKPLAMTVVLYLGVGLLCLVYAAGLISIVTGIADPLGPEGTGTSFTTIEGVRALFASNGGVTVGWTHYLAFDLFVGLWIAKDADAKNFSRIIQTPILLATFMAGPIGLLVWLMLRERSARKFGRGQA